MESNPYSSTQNLSHAKQWKFFNGFNLIFFNAPASQVH